MRRGKTKLELDVIDAKLQRFSGFRQEHKSFLTLAYGHAGKAKILFYDLDSLITSGALHTALQTGGTIFSMDSNLMKAELYYLTIFGAALVIFYFIAPEIESVGSVGVAASQAAAVQELSDYLNVFIPFILGLYVSLCLNRWWSLRLEGIGAVLDATQNVALLMSGMFPGPDWTPLHDQINTWGIASVSLITNSARGQFDIKSLGPARDDLLSTEEIEILEETPYRARPVLVWAWILTLNHKLCEEQNVPPGKYRDIALECIEASNAITLIWTYLRTQLPFAYTHLVTTLVNLTNLVTAVKCGVVMSMAIRERLWSVGVNQILFLLVVPPLYQGLLGISHVIHDPFGEDLLDFPVMAFQEYMNESSVTMSGAGMKCPALAKNWSPPTDDIEPCFDYVEEPSGSKLQEDLTGFCEPGGDHSPLRPAKLKDTAARMELAMKKRADGQQEWVNELLGQCQGLKVSANEMTKKIESLERDIRLRPVAQSNPDAQAVAPSSGWCNAPRVATPSNTISLLGDSGGIRANSV